MQAVDKLHRSTRIDQQGRIAGDDLHQLLTAGDHSAIGEHAQAHHGAAGRCAQLGVGQFEGGAAQAIAEVFGAGLHVAQLLADFTLVLLLTLGHAQFQLQNLTAGAADIAQVFRDRPVDLRVQAFAVEQAVARDVTVAGQFTQALQLLIERGALLLLVAHRALHAGQHGLGTGDVFAQAGQFHVQ
ncbi:hypothetical protein D9M71_555880 [compost metagenome]